LMRHTPGILDQLSGHFNQTLDRIKASSSVLCQAQYSLQARQSNQTYGYQRKLRARMEQSEEFEQLFFNVNIIQGFTNSIHQQTTEMLSKLIEAPDRIQVVLSIFENLCLFKNLSSLNHKMGNLIRIILFDLGPYLHQRDRDMSNVQQQQLEKLKVFAARIKELSKGFESFLGHQLESMPSYEQIMADPAHEAQSGDNQCNFEGLQRNHKALWYLRILQDYAYKFDKYIGEMTRRDLTLIEWQDALRPQILYQRIIPEKELQMFHRVVLQSEEEFKAEAKDFACFSTKRKAKVGQLRSFLREPLVEKDFKAIVTRLSERRAQVDHAYKFVQEIHYELCGMHLSDTQYFAKLSRLVYNSTITTYRRAAPA